MLVLSNQPSADADANSGQMQTNGKNGFNRHRVFLSDAEGCQKLNHVIVKVDDGPKGWKGEEARGSPHVHSLVACSIQFPFGVSLSCSSGADTLVLA